MKAQGEPQRLQIFMMLFAGECCDCDIEAAVCLLQNPASHHLRSLRKAGLEEAQRRPLDVLLRQQNTAMPNQETTRKQRVLILCTANSARSQMAEGVLRRLSGDRYDVFSAGSRATFVNPFAIQAMDEIGVDLRNHTSKTYDQFLGQPFDAVITVCDNAAEACPFLPGQYRRIHWSFPDPAAVEGDEAKLQAFRDVRDGLIERFKAFIAEPA